MSCLEALRLSRPGPGRLVAELLLGLLWLAVASQAQAPATHAEIELDAGGVPIGSRVRLEVNPSLRILGVKLVKTADSGVKVGKKLVTRFEGPSRDSVDLKLIHTAAKTSKETEAVFAFDAAGLKAKPGFHLGFVRLVGRWELASPGRKPDTWRILDEGSLDGEVPVLADRLDRPTVCVSIDRDGGRFRAVIADRCQPPRATGAASE